MHSELVRVWRDVDADDSVNCAIITGAGKTFSAGGDFGMVREIMESFEARTRVWREARDIVYNIVNCRKPVVSAMRGVAVGAGLVCGILADVSIAARDCRITDGHTRLGVAAGDHAAIVWPLLCGMAKAKYYLLTCDLAGRRRGGAHRADLPGGGGCRAGRQSGRGGVPPGRGRAERRPLDQVRAEQLAAHGRTELRRLAGAWSSWASAGRRRRRACSRTWRSGRRASRPPPRPERPQNAFRRLAAPPSTVMMVPLV